jgi:hypothetical protein
MGGIPEKARVPAAGAPVKFTTSRLATITLFIPSSMRLPGPFFDITVLLTTKGVREGASERVLFVTSRSFRSQTARWLCICRRLASSFLCDGRASSGWA